MVKPTSVTPMTLAMMDKLYECHDDECLKLPDGRRKFFSNIFHGNFQTIFSGQKKVPSFPRMDVRDLNFEFLAGETLFPFEWEK